ncbi:quinolinate synthase, L-aspartate oxidase (B protein) subunit [Methylacidimicrobium sp. AP8]|uniref:L-aspartate oxidase n=1 Tax=Methylacidimicrobium sp. AP8 TaxID=2730359 RepID=UPI0018C08001|nr:L-aspartate oxidase [Methylacidimicrobium sp. AP8]CAB4242903.1 quinolinate synthase, L-aspartate oxidase (B protein) subunit [Methylacidimicrobium sp. AP8]
MESPKQFDFLVIGSGLAGLFYALEASKAGTVAILTKRSAQESNTLHAQGGVACVASSADSFELHIQDTLDTGAGLCKEGVVRTIIEEGPERIRDLARLGVRFSTRPGEGGEIWDLGKEGGHSRRRIFHVDDATGREIEQVLLRAVRANPRITVLEDHQAVDLITLAKLGYASENRCVGCYVLDRASGRVEAFCAHHTLLATGGCGKVYLYTSNPDVATGDGVAMAFRAGVPVANMEFIQFHPTCLYHPQAKSFLISEALRGEGALLLNHEGHRFLLDADPRGELAPRDIVARAIDAEIKRSGHPCVYLDIRRKGKEFLRERFPTIYAACLRYGIDMAEDRIPVVPAAHYQCGGVVTDVDGRTELPGLWAAGEVACTGLHGANRLASNSLLEAMVVSYRAARASIAAGPVSRKVAIPSWDEGSAADPDELVVVAHNWREIRELMWDYVGIVRTRKRLHRAGVRLQNLAREIREFYWSYRLNADLIELRNLVLVASLVVDSALERRESRGLHYVLDFPGPDDSRPPADTILRLSEPSIRA